MKISKYKIKKYIILVKGMLYILYVLKINKCYNSKSNSLYKIFDI